nr:hypothetical protein [uncultured Sphingobacterium sp.]
MNRNTQEERELLSELMVITDLIKGVEKGTRTTVSAEENRQLNVILSKIRETYPTVKFPINLNNSCGTCVKDFIDSLIPVYNRLYMQALEAELNEPETDVVIGSVEYNKGNVNEENPFNPIGHDDVEEVKEVKKTITRKKK